MGRSEAISRRSLLKKLQLSSFIAFDFETTGLDPKDDRIIEIAAVRFEEGKPAGRYVTLVNPGRPIPDFITEITSISNAMVEEAPREQDIVNPLAEFIGSLPLVAHNIRFDEGFLRALFRRHGKDPMDWELYDTLQLSRTFLFDLPAFNLATVSEYFELSTEGAHRAEKDTENCGQIFLGLLDVAAGYPLEVISKMSALLNKINVPNRELYDRLAKTFVSMGVVNGGLRIHTIDRIAYENVFINESKRTAEDRTFEEIFGTGGLLHSMMEHYEDRPNQVKYGLCIDSILEQEEGIGILEAGTGLGKTLAYLFSAIKKVNQTREKEGPVIISCHTKHLQDQLFYKDLPYLAQTLELPVRAVTLKGRSNYLCKTRLDRVVAEAHTFLSPQEIESILPIFPWLEWTQTGDMSECAGFWNSRQRRVAPYIRSETGYCTTQLCNRHEGCFFGKIRKAVFSADIIVVNHALLLSEIKAPGFLPSFDSVIVDEAHNLVSTAYSQFEIEISQPLMLAAIRNIDPADKGFDRWRKILKDLGKMDPKVQQLADALQARILDTQSAVETFFKAYSMVCEDRFDRESIYVKKVILKDPEVEFGTLHGERQHLMAQLSHLIGIISDLERILVDREDYLELYQAMEQHREELKSLGELVQTLLTLSREDWVYWQEGEIKTLGKGVEKLFISLHGAPVDVAGLLSNEFFKFHQHVILTSATLSIDGSFDYYLNRLGLAELEDRDIITKIFPSPFHYDDQVTYFQYGGSIPLSTDPSALSTVIYDTHKKYNKRIMALFTSRNTLKNTYQALRAKPGGKDLPIFAQITGTARYAMIRGMYGTPNGILLGTSSFWEGVDFPRDLLEILIITKLPFDVPTEPIIKAYSNLIAESGGNSFLEYTVPECVIRFRQGFGRLIRTTKDQGVFIVLDERVLTKRYGEHFHEAIPVRMHAVMDLDDMRY